MRTIKLTLAYDGTRYAGWQVQPDAATVQGALEAAIAQVTGQSTRVLASGRTDSGVHAAGQVVGFTTPSELEPDVLRRALNAVLPSDVAVLDVVEVAAGFHAIRDAVRKRYSYTIHDGPVRDVFGQAYHWHYPQRLDAAAMHRAAQTLLGKHDFSSFETSGAPRETSVRTITDISVHRQVAELGSPGSRTSQLGSPGSRTWVPKAQEAQDASGCLGHSEALAQNYLHIEVEADGFLYNMVRAIVGTLVEVGRGAKDEPWLEEVLAAQDRRRAGPTAPPEGLCLLRVDYF